MRRRDLVKALGMAPLLAPLAAHAQPSDRMRTIGILFNADETEADAQRRLAAFHRGMNALGWVEGKNFRVEMRWGRGSRDLVHAHARDLVARQALD